MNYALVGIGKWGKTYIKTLKEIEGSSLVATCSRNQGSYHALTQELRIAPHFESFDEMLESVNIDTVIIATQPSEHYRIARRAMWLNKNVICEKPCMFSPEEFSIIEELSEPSIFFTDYTNLYHKVIDKMQDILPICNTKPILKLVNIGSGPYRENYSDLWDYGAHVASVVYHLFPYGYFYIESYEQTKEGNHHIKLNGPVAIIEMTFGNKGDNRVHSFELLGGSHSAYWENDRTENPLKLVLEKFATGKVSTNISLSRRISSLLTDIERMNKLSKMVS
jgi:hypothetical protein